MVTTLITPFGMPASSANAAAARADNGVSLAGFTTVVHPQARAAPSYLIEVKLKRLIPFNVQREQ